MSGADLHATSDCSIWAPCGLCGFTDTEAPEHCPGSYEGLSFGATVECDDCGALLTFVDFDHWDDLGSAYTWEASPPSPAATWAAIQRASEWRHREDDAVKNPERYSTDAPWGLLGDGTQQEARP